jgi:hypothetical protein
MSTHLLIAGSLITKINYFLDKGCYVLANPRNLLGGYPYARKSLAISSTYLLGVVRITAH